MKAYLILEDGHIFTGTGFGHPKSVICEIVFNTAMSAYTEIITDPSNENLAVVMTYPLIGNYGVCKEDFESDKPCIGALIVSTLSETASNFRNDISLGAILKQAEIPGIRGIDTRALVRLLRDTGTKRGLITFSQADAEDIDGVLERIKGYSPELLRPRGFTEYNTGASKRIAVIDNGVKRSTIERICKYAVVGIFGEDTEFEEIKKFSPNGVLLSGGSSIDPRNCTGAIELAREIYKASMPVMAMGLGHQIMALATGAETKKMKCGHRGANYPVKDLLTGRVYITLQNHGYVVDTDSVDSSVAQAVFINVNDKTIEGLQYIKRDILSIQFEPGVDEGFQLLDEFLLRI